MRNISLILFVGATIGLTACSRDGVGDPKVVPDSTSAQEIFKLAEAERAKKNNKNAGDYYLEVERLYPFTSQSEVALIRAAQTYHDGDALVESRIAAERYLQFFPGGKHAPLAQYLVALSYYDGIVDVSRDQERTFQALQALQLVLDKYPDSEYAKLSKPKFEICLDQLAGKEMEIGRYYLRRGHYTSAISRFKAVVQEYPENNHTPEAYHRMIEGYLALGLVDEAKAVLGEFGKSKTKNEWYDRSKALLNTGTQPNAAPNIVKRVFTS